MGVCEEVVMSELAARLGLFVIRYVVTHVNRDGMRTLTMAAQGRNTFETPEKAQEMVDALIQNNGDWKLSDVFGDQVLGTFEVRACECWPGHFDPKGIWFDSAEEIEAIIRDRMARKRRQASVRDLTA